MKWYLDTEFLEDGVSIELISIALVHENGSPEYYAGNLDCDIERVREDKWLSEHVLPHLPPFEEGKFWKPTRVIGSDILALLGIERGSAHYGTPEIWADFASYDWVAFCQIYGRMIDLPSGLPMFCFDLQQDIRSLGIHRSQLPVQDPKTEHDALKDARWLRGAHIWARSR